MMTTFPKIFMVQPSWPRQEVADLGSTVKTQLDRLQLADRVKPGQTVAVTAGSRGIVRIGEILREVASCIRGLGAVPFIVTAMGSHAGATASGQRQMLSNLGITESACGCEIRAGMETIVAGQTAAGFPLHTDRIASEADHILICGRVKPHTGFTGSYQSGLCKMMMIGLGNELGATTYHRAVRDLGFQNVVETCVPILLEKLPVLGGLAIIESAHKQVAQLASIPADRLLLDEPALLKSATSLMARLPFDVCDVLIVDEIGKDISGTGMDTNVVGRKHHDHEAESDEVPRVKRILVRGLTEKTHGNALGIGMAEFCRTQLVERMDREATVVNAMASGHVTGAMIPVHFPTDREMLAAAISTLGLTPSDQCRLLWIRNTLALSTIAT
ncbi:MAG: DUF2088 domain-containing protein, partial [Planctomycetales bacterium]|nr:DUF2088 domain-containing protein [Planctomycetales bacterium]